MGSIPLPAIITITANDLDIDRAISNAALMARFTGCAAYPAVGGMYKGDSIDCRLEAGEVHWHQLERSKLELE